MRKLALIVSAIVFFINTSAQTTTPGVRLTIGTAAKTYTGTYSLSATNGPITSITYQIGLPLLGVTANLSSNTYSGSSGTYTYTTSRTFDIGFPWGELFINKTFANDYFTISKGYFADRVELNWRILNNESIVTNFLVYRTEDLSSTNPVWGDPIKTISKSDNSFTDLTAEGGKLYRYKLRAIGSASPIRDSDVESEYNTFITGVGYRNPTGIVSGNISFIGGNPVKDVLVSAVAEGGTSQFGNSLVVPSDGNIWVPKFKTGLKDSLTVQLWLNYANTASSGNVNLFKLISNSGDEINATAQITNSGNTLTVNVGSATFSVTGYLPTGKLNNRGDDTYERVIDNISKFIHLSFILKDEKIPELYINGRPITSTYLTYMNGLLTPNAATLGTSGLSNIPINTNANGNGIEWNSVKVGGGVTSYFDDVRIWAKALSAEEIRTTYKRYLRGDENSLKLYLRFNEAGGSNVYDMSFKGSVFNGNDAQLTRTSGSTSNWWNVLVPNADQLGILGVSDVNGNYSISAIPYTGSGELFKLTPSLGVHKFNPKQETLFIGASSSVVNRVNFTDESSFTFKGRILYDSRGVFPAGPSSDDVTGDIRDNESYNAYVIGGVKYPKGEYWGEYGTGDNANRIVKLKRYAPIPLVGAYVYVDNNIVVDANNNPVVSDANGRFSIKVPIGNHSITVKSNNHIFNFGGRFPARDSVLDVATNTYNFTDTYAEFFQDQDEERIFIDNTKVTVVGRVVGGKVESAKPIGFGYNGAALVDIPGTNPVEQALISSVNNIGTAQITLGYRQPGVSSITDEYKTVFNTNTVTGEYRANVLPLTYELNRNDVYIASQNTDAKRRFLTQNEILNFSNIAYPSISKFTYPNSDGVMDTLARSLPYNYQKDFIYVSLPEVAVLEQFTDSTFKIGDTTFRLAANQTPLYTQLSTYKIKFQKQERYYNYEKASAQQLSMVPAKDGNFIITNNLALPNSESKEEDSLNASIVYYTFKAGLANTDVGTNFQRSISAIYRNNGVDYPITGFKTTGIILGGASDGSQGVITAGPDLVDIILRDPPGSGSSATIEKGTSVSIKQSNAGVISSETQMDIVVDLGVKMLIGGSILGPAIETAAENEFGTRLKGSVSSKNGKDVTTTYSFAQSISTSSAADVTGAAGDLYIGKSNNYYFGLYDNIAPSSIQKYNNNNLVSIPITTTSGVKYISKSKAVSFTPEGAPTTFVYSQDYVLNTLLPFYENIVDRMQRGDTANMTNLKPITTYQSSIKLWKQAILRNEAQKSYAYKNKNDLKNSIKDDILSKYRIGGVLTKAGSYLQTILNEEYFKNISIDAKAGSYAGTSTVASATNWTTEFSLSLAIGLVMESGFSTGGSGFTIKIENENTLGYEYSQEEGAEKTQTVSYSLADNDPGNVLSVDILNIFDGNGPIFVTQGGASSCPVELGEKSHFFKASMLKNYLDNNYDTLSINLLDEDYEEDRVELSKGSLALEVPDFSVNRASISGVPETGKAAFTFTMMNLSALEPASSSFKLRLNPNSNPNGARLSVDPNGIPISLSGTTPATYTIFVEKGRADVFRYDSLEIVFESACDGNISKSVFISVEFIESCTKVDVARPNNNWVMNAATSFSNGNAVPLAVVLNGYNTSYNGFKNMALQYRMQGSPSWTLLRSYVANQIEKNSMVASGSDAANIEIINGNELSYGFNVTSLGLADGNYEIRAVSYCANGTIYESTPISGKVDLNTPLLFGTPSPTDGILSIGDDLKLRFSEPVKTNGTMTRVDFLVQKNQLPVAHESALSFTGANSKANIQMPYLKSGNLSIEFWLKNQTSSSAIIIAQQNGFSISATRNSLTFTVGNQSITADIVSDGTYHHYTTSYNSSTGRFTIIEDDRIAKTALNRSNLLVDNNSQIDLGGTAFVGKIHELRIWNTEVSRESSVANMNVSLIGNEDGLIGYWPMIEGNGNLAKDLARFKHITLDNVNWDIFPNTQSYAFDGTNYLAFNNASKSIFSSTMDGTISFWMKSDNVGPATLLSNGKGDTTDLLTTSGYRNKWAFDIDVNGNLSLKAENNSYSFGPQKMNDGKWHHVAVVLKRKGNLSMYVDGVQSQNYPIQGLGGFSGSAIFVGGKGQISPSNIVTVNNLFTGQLDDVQIWNLAKQADQIAEDRFYEQDYNTTGLIFYAPLNQPEQSSNNGPKYYIPLDFQTKVSDYAVLSANSALAYSSVTPPIKPIRNTERMVTNAIVNGDEMIINPQITDWASVEKKIAYVTVANMYDLSDNRQESPITWTAYITKNPLKWFVEGYNNNIDLVLDEKKTGNYQLVIANVGGNIQNFTLAAPSWLKLQSRAGTIAPNSQVKINFTVDTTLSAGNYFDQIKLTSKYNFTEKIQFNLRVLKAEPNWNFNPLNFEENMNVISKIRIDGKLSADTYDKVIAYYLDSVRGIAPIEYDRDLDEYYALLTIYGNADGAGLPINFKVWDASDGRLKSALFNDSTTIKFQPNLNVGNYSQPVVFSNSGNETQILSMNKGWTWLSFYLNDPNFSQLNTFFKTAKLTKGDVIKSSSPALFDVYNVSPIAGQTGWAGSISLNGGLSASKMYKVKLEVPQKLMTTGLPVNLSTQNFVLDTNWVGLPYSANRNLPINEALAYLDAQNGDIIKSQSQFAIYDKNARLWKGNLTTMYAGEGYMIKTSKQQTFTYPAYANTNAGNALVGSSESAPAMQSYSIAPNSLISTVTFNGSNPSPSYLSDNIIEPVKLNTDLSKYGETMNIVAKIPKEFDQVVFYNTTTNQIIGQSQDVIIDNSKFVFATIYGDSIINVKAELVNKDSKVSATNSIVFVPNTVMGTIKSPYNIEYIKPSSSEMNAYPNPFINNVTLEFNSTIQGTAYLSIYNEQTQLIETKQINVAKGMNRYIYQANQANMGNYLIFKVDVGDQHFTKLVFKL
jgi:hypothetical protein